MGSSPSGVVENTSRNQHLSFSRVSRYEACPRAYQLHYLEKRAAHPGLALRFGKMVHAALERIVREHVDDERDGVLDVGRAVEVYRQAWNEEGLHGVDVFEEGLRIVRDFVALQGPLDHRTVLGIEKEFQLPIGPFTVLGFIDRVDWVDDETVRVTDYKSNHQIFSRDQVDSSLQLSLYAVAARRIWPWAKKIELRFWMLRHGLFQDTSRTEQQLADAILYLETIGTQMESASQFEARINANCSYCDHQKDCEAYREALAGRQQARCDELTDLETVATEREKAAQLAKLFYARKDKLDGILKAHLKHHEELVVGGMRYRMFKTTSYEYPLEPTIAALSAASGLSRVELIRQLGAIDPKALQATLQILGECMDSSKLLLLKSELQFLAKKHHSPRLWATAVKGAASLEACAPDATAAVAVEVG